MPYSVHPFYAAMLQDEVACKQSAYELFILCTIFPPYQTGWPQFAV